MSGRRVRHGRSTVTVSRRTALAGLGTALTGGLAGCSSGAHPVEVLAAGSLHRALSEGLSGLTTPEIRVETYGSTRCARMVASGQRDPDILVLADDELFESILDAPWYTLFASNALVLAYDGTTPRGQAIAAADPWFQPLADGDVRLGRTDPDLDPLGYRTLFLLDLAADHYGRPDLPGQVLAPDQTYPETELLAQLETGGVDAAFVYENMAVERGYDYRRLPPEIDQSSRDHAARYQTVSHTLADGTTVHGDVIEYAARRRTDRSTTRTVFADLVGATDRYLATHGFELSDRYPLSRGDAPDEPWN